MAHPRIIYEALLVANRISVAGHGACSRPGVVRRHAARRSSGANAAARPSGPDVVTLNFVNADIEGVVKAVSEITGKNFVLDPRVKGTVNIVSAKPMSRALVYEVFLSALRLQGFAAVEERGMVMIVPEIDAKLHRSPTLGPQDRPRAGGRHDPDAGVQAAARIGGAAGADAAPADRSQQHASPPTRTTTRW